MRQNTRWNQDTVPIENFSAWPRTCVGPEIIVRINLGMAAGHDDARRRVLSFQPVDKTAYIADGAPGYRTAIDYYKRGLILRRRVKARLLEVSGNDGAVPLIGLAARRMDKEAGFHFR